MSDLLPLLTATLKDKVLLEAQEEIQTLRSQLVAVEVLSQEGESSSTVYARGNFSDGCYGPNPNLWQVDLSPAEASCRLADLGQVRVCVGGGFSQASFTDRSSNNSGSIEPDGDDDDDKTSVLVAFCFADKLWLMVIVHGWPKEDWIRIVHEEEQEPADMLGYLTDTIAVRYPEAMAEFTEVSFFCSAVHGAIQRLIPQQRRQELQERRDQELEESEGYDNLTEWVMTRMRSMGYTGGAAVFMPQFQQVMDAVERFAIDELNENSQDFTTVLIRLHRLRGGDRFAEIVNELASNIEAGSPGRATARIAQEFNLDLDEMDVGDENV